MADTSFVSKVTQIATGWLQDINNFFYRHTGFTSKATPVDADTWYLWDSVAAAWKTLSLANLKTVLAAACSAGWNAATATTANRVDSGLITIASATTPDIFAAAGNTINYTGTATCTGFVAAPKAGMERKLICAGACLFTAGTNLLIEGIPSGTTVTLAANAIVDVVAITTTQFRMTYSVSGTCTAGCTGLTTSPTTTVNYTVTNGLANLRVVQAINGTSNTTGFSLTGFPATISAGNTTNGGPVKGYDNTVLSFLSFTAAGSSIAFFLNAGTLFTTSGLKGLTSDVILIYRIA